MSCAKTSSCLELSMPFALVLLLMSVITLVSPAAQAKSILYIGDSHSYISPNETPGQATRFGSALIAALGRDQHSVHYYGACGASARTWATGPTTSCGATKALPHRPMESRTQGRFESLSQLNSPAFDTVIINLGDNLFNWQREGGKSRAAVRSSDEVIAQVRQLLASVRNNQECVWVGPTYHNEGSLYSKSNQAVDHMYRALNEALAGRCRLIDSRGFFSTTTPGDGLHFSDPESARWGSLVSAEIKKLWTGTTGAAPGSSAPPAR